MHQFSSNLTKYLMWVGGYPPSHCSQLVEPYHVLQRCYPSDVMFIRTSTIVDNTFDILTYLAD